jgi:hypothetical protein
MITTATFKFLIMMLLVESSAPEVWAGDPNLSPRGLFKYLFGVTHVTLVTEVKPRECIRECGGH